MRSSTFYGVSEAGNFEGRSILHLAGGVAAPEPEGLDDARRALLRGAGRAGRARGSTTSASPPGTR